MSEINMDELKKTLNEASKNISLKNETENKRQAEREQVLGEWKKSKVDYYISIPEFDIPKKLLGVTLKTGEYHALILYGEGGLGKTILVTNEVKKLVSVDNWDYRNGYSTPLALYEILYEAKDKKLLLLDDIEGVFGNAIATTILKGALWESGGKRIVQYNSKSDKALDLPSAFEFKAKIVILCNRIPNQNDVSVSALISRTVPYELKLSYEQKLDILDSLISNRKDLTQKQQQDCKNLIRQETSQATKHFNFRLLRKVIAFVKEDKANARELFKATTPIDDLRQSVLDLSKTGSTVSEQYAKFYEATGRSKRTFHRIRKELDIRKSAKVPSKKDVTHSKKKHLEARKNEKTNTTVGNNKS